MDEVGSYTCRKTTHIAIDSAVGYVGSRSMTSFTDRNKSLDACWLDTLPVRVILISANALDLVVRRSVPRLFGVAGGRASGSHLRTTMHSLSYDFVPRKACRWCRWSKYCRLDLQTDRNTSVCPIYCIPSTVDDGAFWHIQSESKK